MPQECRQHLLRRLVANNICAALGFYNAVVGGRQYWGAYAMVRPTLGQATDSALDECRKQARQKNACVVRTTVCADGGHRRQGGCGDG